MQKGNASPPEDKWLVGLLLSVLALALTSNSAWSESEGYGPPGQLYSVGEHRLHLFCVGDGEQTVIFDSGVGGNYLDWVQVQPKVSKFTRVCSYDRAGYGWSEAGPRPRISSVIVDELRSLLQAAEITPPYILVGHSFGGLNIQNFAGRFNTEVSALVLVDAVHPEQFQRFEENGIEVPVANSRRIMLGSREQVTYGIPEQLHDIAFLLAREEKAMGAMYNEVRNMPESSATTANLDMPDVPIVVISHGERVWEEKPLTNNMEQVWQELQTELANKNGYSKQIIADSSGHQIQLDQPHLIIDVIKELVTQPTTK